MAAEEAGRTLYRDQRKARAAGGSENCITVNITARGAEIHDIRPEDLCEVEVREDGVLIRKHPAQEGDDGGGN